MTRAMELTVKLVKNEEGGFTARCVEFPGAISQGETEQEALDNVSSAIHDILTFRRKQAQEESRRNHERLRVIEIDA